MNEVIGKHYLDLDIHQNTFTSFTCKQYNTAEWIYVSVYDNGDSITNLNTLLTSLEVKINTPDNRALKLSTSDTPDLISMASDVISIHLPQSVFLEHGKAECEIILIKGGNQLATMSFQIKIIKSVYSEDSVVSDAYETDAVTELKNFVSKNADIAKQSANTATQKATEASKSATTAITKANESASSANLSKSYAVGGTKTRTGEDTDNSKYYKEQAKVSETNASSKATSASTSASNAKTSETNAKNYATNASTSATNASNSAKNASSSADTASTKASEASTSAENAKVSETNASTSETNAKNYANTASSKATSASTSANTATTKANEAKASATSASTSASNAKTSETNAKNYATGTTDSAKYYYEQSKNIAESFSGALRPMGTVAFSNLPTLANASEGDMYNISNQFTTTVDFKEGAGSIIPAGANIYKTSDGKWDVLAGTPVTGVKGNAESSYHRGNVNIKPSNIGMEIISTTEPTFQEVGSFWLLKY